MYQTIVKLPLILLIGYYRLFFASRSVDIRRSYLLTT